MAPIIVSTDKTQLTQFSGGKQAYPVYLTLGNIRNRLRRRPSEQACILLAYLLMEKVAKRTSSTPTMSALYQRAFHAAMEHIFEPLKTIDHKEGISMTSGNGTIHRVHPILAAYVTDYLEQCLVICAKSRTCPKCTAPFNNLGDGNKYPQCLPSSTIGNIPTPFWLGLPHTKIHLAIMSDILHQVYQGVLSHLVKWCQLLMTKLELDRRIRCLPPAVGLRHFKNGISGLSQISGSKHKNIGKILLGCIIDKLHPHAVTACCALLDFIYLAQYTTHDKTTLGYMDTALDTWHKYKTFFIRVGARDHFNIPKLHFLQHYVFLIHLFGTTNNYNTEMFKRLHIEFSQKGLACFKQTR